MKVPVIESTTKNSKVLVVNSKPQFQDLGNEGFFSRGLRNHLCALQDMRVRPGHGGTGSTAPVRGAPGFGLLG